MQSITLHTFGNIIGILFDYFWPKLFITLIYRIIMYNIDIKLQGERKYFPIIAVNNMKCVKHYITSKVCEETEGSLWV